MAITAVIPKALKLSRTRFVNATGISLSMSVMSCEKRFVISPVSVVVKNLKGALITVFNAALWSFDPDTLTIVR